MKRILILLLAAAAMLLVVNTVEAEFGNDRVEVIDGGALGLNIRVTDPDGIRYVVVERWPDGVVEFDAGALNCPLQFDFWFGRVHLAHGHRIFVTDCQQPNPAGGIFEMEEGSLDINRFQVGGTAVETNTNKIVSGLALAIILIAAAAMVIYNKRRK